MVGERELHFNEPCCIQTIEPFPQLKENCYFEIKVIELPETTNLFIGIAPKDISNNNMPGRIKNSISYSIKSGELIISDFTHEYGNKLYPGDILGCGYRPNKERVFYTRNGRRYPRIVFEAHEETLLYPTIYSDGPCTIEYNFGQVGFVLISANSRNYGLSQPNNLIVPPPSYQNYSSDMSIISPRETNSFFSDSTCPNTPSATSPAHCPPPYNTNS
ncbi:hypothetical protein K502DRAFT_288864 [Neoconidiobolus thromboides FSU 785]|nr:hypothetical protein K502DRAFT_288864 [Neoconidiobolus thromboides FSU 785]